LEQQTLVDVQRRPGVASIHATRSGGGKVGIADKEECGRIEHNQTELGSHESFKFLKRNWREQNARRGGTVFEQRRRDLCPLGEPGVDTEPDAACTGERDSAFVAVNRKNGVEAPSMQHERVNSTTSPHIQGDTVVMRRWLKPFEHTGQLQTLRPNSAVIIQHLPSVQFRISN
jgi:hypothetical protein